MQTLQEKNTDGRQAVNPMVPVAYFKLADGVERRFCWDLNAMVVFEHTMRENPTASLTKFGVMRVILLAGFHADAIERKETEWTLPTIGALTTPQILDSMVQRIEQLRELGVNGPGEKKASQSLMARLKRWVGAKFSRSPRRN